MKITVLKIRNQANYTTKIYYWASVSEPHTCDFNAVFSHIYATIVSKISAFRYFI